MSKVSKDTKAQLPIGNQIVKPQKKDVLRYERYARLIELILDRAKFSLREIKDACTDEIPSFVTRLVNGLVKEGVLKTGDEDGLRIYAWAIERDDFSASEWLDRQIYGPRIKRSPTGERPRERLLAHGVAKLRTAELLAILIRTGRPGESALQAGEKITNRFADQPVKLAEAGRGELKSISNAVEVTAYCQIMAGIELGRRLFAGTSDGTATIKTKIRSTAEAIAYCAKKFERLILDAKQEELHVVTLNAGWEVMNTHDITVGLLDSSYVHPREVFRPAVQDAAKAIVLIHNHPSGDPTPSREDLFVTKQLEKAATNLDIELLDHLILARDGITSIREYREMTNV